MFSRKWKLVTSLSPEGLYTLLTLKIGLFTLTTLCLRLCQVDVAPELKSQASAASLESALSMAKLYDSQTNLSRLSGVLEVEEGGVEP